MKQNNHQSNQLRDLTPIAPSKVSIALNQGKLDPFDQNYTLTGLLKDIESSINQLISSKRHQQNAPIITAELELEMLEKVQEQVVILKTIVVHNINQIFSSIYPSHKDFKSENPTNHTDSQKRRNQEQLLNKSMTISDFDIDGNNKINALEVNKESLAHHQKVYAQEKQGADSIDIQGRRKIDGENRCQQQIRIEEGNEENLEDLICYQDEKTIIINKKRYMDSLRNIKINNFSPIAERPMEEEYSVEKGNLEQKKENIVIDEKRFFFNPYRDNLYVNLMAKKDEEIKKSLFGQKCQTFKRVSHRKFNYLQQLGKY